MDDDYNKRIDTKSIITLAFSVVVIISVGIVMYGAVAMGVNEQTAKITDPVAMCIYKAQNNEQFKICKRLKELEKGCTIENEE